ncbi:MAG: hypothetical protein AAF996_01130 [Pseudomonadota bacterium]
MHRSNLAPKRVAFRDIRYRSVTEARTAVFFTFAGIAFQYEPHVFELINGKRYVPDFYLPEFETHVEVKPEDPIIRDLERHKADFLASTGENVWLTRGSPKRGVPWFEHIGVSKLCMIANDNEYSENHWKLHADHKNVVPLCSGPHSRPCLWYDDVVMNLAFKQAETFLAREQIGASVGSLAKMVLEDSRRARSERHD